MGPLDVSVPEVYNGSDIHITCHIATIGFPSDAMFDFKWTLDGVDISPTSVSRFSIVNTRDRDFPELQTSTLYIRPILTRHAGKYSNIRSNPR